MQRRKPMKRSGRIAPKARTTSERERIYGPKARVAWVKASPCVCCGAVGQCQNHHVVSGGMGRKADSDTIVPLCPACHHAVHTGELGRSKEWWREQARLTELAWQQVAS